MKTKDFKATIPALLFDPGFFVFDFAPNVELTKFLLVDENILEQSPFVDIRFEPLSQAHFWVNTKELFALEGGHNIPRPQPVYIFHHAFVCSTLLARCLNQIDAFFSLKEPWILRRLADFKRAHRQGLSGSQWQVMLCKYVMLLCRNYQSGQIPVIKVTNVANNLLVDVLRFMPSQRILYLYSDLESFLISNLKKTNDTQQKMPGLAKELLSDGDFARKFPRMSNPSRLSFVQVCALIWLVNLYNFKEVVEQHASSQVKTLDSNVLLNDMSTTLVSLARFFGHVPVPAEVQRMMDSQVVQTNAKDQSKQYGNEQRQFESKQIKSRYARELDSTAAWINPLIRQLGVMEFMQSYQLRS